MLSLHALRVQIPQVAAIDELAAALGAAAAAGVPLASFLYVVGDEDAERLPAPKKPTNDSSLPKVMN